jgi:NAD(P)-dependent dehydrogenase (short-subunit alcohol dehydrogenase family)
MDLKLIGKRALVTGSTAGIGAAIAAGLAGEGAGVIVNGRSPVDVDKAVQTAAAGDSVSACAIYSSAWRRHVLSCRSHRATHPGDVAGFRANSERLGDWPWTYSRQLEGGRKQTCEDAHLE